MLKKKKRAGILFAGGEGVGVGFKDAGLDCVWGIEYDPQIAAVARANGFNTTCIDILKTCPHEFEKVWILHASPPCPNFSTANNINGGEEENDRLLARKIREFIRVLQPEFFTLENVFGYRHSLSFLGIWYELQELGYSVEGWHVMLADYGVPQTRQRLVLLARKDGRVPELPLPTHAENPIPSLFGTPDRWVGWYEAIEDLIPELPSSQFAKWQLKRLPEEYKTLLLPGGNATGGSDREAEQPSQTVGDIRRVGNMPRALLVEPSNATGGSDRLEDQPSQVITTPGGGRVHRAFIMDAANPNGNEPNRVVSADAKYRAFVIDGKLSTSGSSKSLQVNGAERPYGTVISSHAAQRDARAAVPIIMNDADSKNPVKNGDRPMGTVVTNDTGGSASRALVPGRVVRMTPRALARFQTFPDWYKLPEKNSLAVKIIGNAVPPLFMKKLAEHLLNGG